RGAGEAAGRGHERRSRGAVGRRPGGTGQRRAPRSLRAAARRRDVGRRDALRASGRGGGGLGDRRSRDPRTQSDVRLRSGHLGTPRGRPARRQRGRLEYPAMKILVIDVGGTNLKVGLQGVREPLKIPSGPEMSAARMAAEVKKATAGWKYDAVS